MELQHVMADPAGDIHEEHLLVRVVGLGRSQFGFEFAHGEHVEPLGLVAGHGRSHVGVEGGFQVGVGVEVGPVGLAVCALEEVGGEVAADGGGVACFLGGAGTGLEVIEQVRGDWEGVSVSTGGEGVIVLLVKGGNVYFVAMHVLLTAASRRR